MINPSSWVFSLMKAVKLGMRIEGAMQFMTYEKMLRLRSGGDRVLSRAITFCTNDQERIFECVAGGVLAFGNKSYTSLQEL